MRRSSAAASAGSSRPVTRARSAWENSRPIAAPICATLLADPSRSSRDISEAWRLAGTGNAGEAADAGLGAAAPSSSASNTALVISSDEQRYSIRALDDMAADLFRQRPAA